MKKLNINGRLLTSAAVVGLFSAVALTAQAQSPAAGAKSAVKAGEGDKPGMCMGANSCKGTSACMVKGANDCASKNECKGKGWTEVSKKDCDKLAKANKAIKFVKKG